MAAASRSTSTPPRSPSEGDVSREEEIAKAVAEHGWTAISISDSEPPFVYTAGLMFSHDHPELIVLGLPENGYGIVAVMADEIGKGRSFTDTDRHDNVLVTGQVATRDVHPTRHEMYLGYAMGYCREQGRMGELGALQVFWPDRDGKFPFEPNCDEGVYAAQPRLDLPATESELREWRDRWGG